MKIRPYYTNLNIVAVDSNDAEEIVSIELDKFIEQYAEKDTPEFAEIKHESEGWLYANICIEEKRTAKIYMVNVYIPSPLDAIECYCHDCFLATIIALCKGTVAELANREIEARNQRKNKGVWN